jgi:glycerophosphoryl diester phosphodiesterase
VAHGQSIVHPYDTMVDRAFMAAARLRSLRVNVWMGQRPSDERLQQLVDLGVDGMITDAPTQVLRAVGR